jgi:enoyl-[acyl-carrier-protein] reductase (NADH)
LQGSPENVADAIVFMLSDMAEHVTGQVIGVEGGLSGQRPMPSLSAIYDAK